MDRLSNICALDHAAHNWWNWYWNGNCVTLEFALLTFDRHHTLPQVTCFQKLSEKVLLNWWKKSLWFPLDKPVLLWRFLGGLWLCSCSHLAQRCQLLWWVGKDGRPGLIFGFCTLKVCIWIITSGLINSETLDRSSQVSEIWVSPLLLKQRNIKLFKTSTD